MTGGLVDHYLNDVVRNCLDIVVFSRDRWLKYIIEKEHWQSGINGCFVPRRVPKQISQMRVRKEVGAQNFAVKDLVSWGHLSTVR